VTLIPSFEGRLSAPFAHEGGGIHRCRGLSPHPRQIPLRGGVARSAGVVPLVAPLVPKTTTGAKTTTKKVLATKLFNPILSLMKKRISPINKLFGDLTYTRTGNEEEYNIVAFEENIKRSICAPSSMIPSS